MISGLSLLEGKDDILEDWRNKFLNTYTVSTFNWLIKLKEVQDVNIENWLFEFHDV